MAKSVLCFCVNPECIEDLKKGRFEFQVAKEKDVVCPKCGANEAPFVGTIVPVHFMIRDKNGYLRGQGGLTYRLACMPDRKRLSPDGSEAASGVLTAVTCPECRAAAESQNVAPHQGVMAPVDANGFLLSPKGT